MTDYKTLLKEIRYGGDQLRSAMETLEEICEEPLRSKFGQVKATMIAMLARLPSEDQIPSANTAADLQSQALRALEIIRDLQSANDKQTAARTEQKKRVVGLC